MPPVGPPLAAENDASLVASPYGCGAVLAVGIRTQPVTFAPQSGGMNALGARLTCGEGRGKETLAAAAGQLPRAQPPIAPKTCGATAGIGGYASCPLAPRAQPVAS